MMTDVPVWTVYILACADGTLYTGITNNLPARMEKHAKGTGAKYTKGRGPFTLLYAEPHPSRSTALKREAAIKALDRTGKRALAGAG